MDFRAGITLPYLRDELFAFNRFVDLNHKANNKNKIITIVWLIPCLFETNLRCNPELLRRRCHVKYGLSKRSSYR